MKWFGQGWGAPICDIRTKTIVPTWLCCTECDKKFKGDDQGLLLPNQEGKHIVAYHVVCFLRAVGVGKAQPFTPSV